MRFPERDHLLKKAKNALIRLKLGPVKPPDFVILVVGIVVTELRVQEFITGPEHRDAIRQQEQTAEVLDLLSAKRHDVRRCSFVPFMTAVPTVILIHAVLIVMTVLPVVLLVVGNQVIERETIMRIYIVHGLVRMIGIGAAVRKQIVTAINAEHQV